MTTQINLPSEPLYFAGYYIIRLTPRPDYLDKNLTPENLCNMSDCISDQFPGVYGLSWAEIEQNERLQWQKNMNLSREEYKELTKEFESAFDDENVGWSGVYQHLATAKYFFNKYLNAKKWRILGTYTTAHYRSEFMQSEKEAGQKNGQVMALEKEIPFTASPEKVLGFDILGFEMGGAHSFLCNNLEQQFFNKLNIQLNKSGLIDNWELAIAGSKYCNDPETPAETVFWLPWIITDETEERTK